MVAVHPFQGLRYNPRRIPDLSAVIAPPYDVIDAEQQEQLYQRSPYNVVRLILGKQYPGDSEQDNRYTRTRQDYDAWRRGQILQAEAEPALYLIKHAFNSQGGRVARIGFIAAMELNDSTRQQVFRHELTLSAPKADRTQLLEAVPANLEPIFCVYPDDHGAIQGHLEKLTRLRRPDASADIDGEEVTLWVLTQAEDTRPLIQHLAQASVLIADGHHRFEVGFANRERYKTLMTYFVSIKDPAVVVHPIHRIATFASAVSGAQLERICAVEPFARQEQAFAWLDKQQQPGRFVVFDGREWTGASVREEALARWLMNPTVPPALAGFDVSILHGLILPQLGIPPSQADGAGIQYAADSAKAAALVKAGTHRMGWFLRGIPLEQVYAVSAQGVRLSQKSTYFYPKVPSGLVINPFE